MRRGLLWFEEGLRFVVVCCVELAKIQKRKSEIRRIVLFQKYFYPVSSVISFLFDTVLGLAYHICLHEDKENIAVTANLNMNLHAPFREGSEAVVRVYLDRIERRKIFFSAVLESKDGSVVYAEATSLFIKVNRSNVVKNN